MGKTALEGLRPRDGIDVRFGLEKGLNSLVSRIRFGRSRVPNALERVSRRFPQHSKIVQSPTQSHPLYKKNKKTPNVESAQS